MHFGCYSRYWGMITSLIDWEIDRQTDREPAKSISWQISFIKIDKMTKHCSIRTDGDNTHLFSTCSGILFLNWTKWSHQEVSSICGCVPTLHLSLQASIMHNPLYVRSLFNQASLTDVGLLMCVWQGRLLWLTHSTIAQLLCRQDDTATFLSWNPSVKKREREQ